MSIPSLSINGELPQGVHVATIEEVEDVFGRLNDRRQSLMRGLKAAIGVLRPAGVKRIFIDGSFTTDKDEPNDIDGCWSNESVNAALLDVRFWDFDSVSDQQEKRESLKEEFGIDFFMAEWIEGRSRKPFPEFFQVNRDGEPKGIIQVDL